jgi:hypothetical protein
LVGLDESGVDTAMTPLYARAPQGQRALGRAPGGHWKRLTILGAMALNGLVATMTVAATTTEVFLAFVQQGLLPALQTRPDSIVAMDNLAPHKAACIRQAFEAAGVAYRYLPPYSPDLNPIEPAWAQIKGDLRQAEARSLAQLDAAMPHALEQITPSNAQGWFRMKGYRSN